MTDISVPIFGERKPDVDYIPRPATYGLYQDDVNRLALILEPFGYYMPGGGMAPSESPKDTLRRECLEELGWDIGVGEFLAHAECLLYSPRSLTHHRNIAKFFRIASFREVARPIEEDHKLIWMPPRQAVCLLKHPHQAWVVQKYAVQ